MQHTLDLVCNPVQANNEKWLTDYIRKKYELKPTDAVAFRILKKSIDARSKNIKINLRLLVCVNKTLPDLNLTEFYFQDVTEKEAVLIIGAGPAGLWAGLRCLELGYKPIIIERGKDVKSRRRDLKAINRDNIVNADSNYCFGEGGAGTYSDGKLYTRSKKRGNVKRILDSLYQHGAAEDILYEAHPHIGTNKLPKIVQSLRETILKYGGKIHFETRLTDFEIEQGLIKKAATNTRKTFEVEAMILATGHSARDIFELLHKKNIKIEAKPFAMGIRIEHPQELINQIQYHKSNFIKHLPAASYKLVEQVEKRGVYSFCMCPGGFIVPAATQQNELVVNGMSPSKRDNKYANSGIVVAIELEDLTAFKSHGPLAGLAFQKSVEKAIWQAGGNTQKAAAQRMTDFVKGVKSKPEDLNETSYIPGLESVPLHEVLPKHIAKRLQKAFVAFGEKMRGYYTEKANIIGSESRTSSPVRIPRNPKTLQHPEIKNLFPCGEGAGFAGGIVSAAIDGELCAEAACSYLVQK